LLGWEGIGFGLRGCPPNRSPQKLSLTSFTAPKTHITAINSKIMGITMSHPSVADLHCQGNSCCAL
jgi:hypothetical protein